MRKEIFWAILLGTVFGLILAGLFFLFKPKKVVQVSPSIQTPQPTITPSSLGLSILSPKNGDVITSSQMKVSGLANPATRIIISGESIDEIFLPAPDGKFEGEIELIGGVNQIKVFSIDENGNQTSSKLIVIYSSAFETGESPKAYMGVVTDITDSTIQIKSIESTIRQLSVTDNITVINSRGGKTKTVKEEDIAIGDFIVAMGFENTPGVLATERILITDPLGDSPTEVKQDQGVNVSATRTTSVYIFKDGEVSKTKSTTIQDEDRVIVVTTQLDNKPSLRSIFIIR